MQKKPHALPKPQTRGISPHTTRQMLKESDFTVVASGAEDLNLEKRSVRLCHEILTFKCFIPSRESHGNSDRKIKSSTQRLPHPPITNDFA